MTGTTKEHWCKGEYSTSVIWRSTFLVSLWIFYGIIPHYLPLQALLFLSAVLLLYDAFLWYEGETFRAANIAVALILNTALVAYLSPLFNLFLTIVITAILFVDIVTAPG